MGIIFGMLKSDGDVVREDDLRHCAAATEKYAPDGLFLCTNGKVGMGCQPYYTHKRATLDSAPVLDPLGNMLAFDGRLDNYKELVALLKLPDPEMSDSAIVLASYDRWGADCFSRFVGDWALALWSNRDQLLYLARDHAGTRTLYFERTNGVIWSTYLENIVACRSRNAIDKEYVTRYLSGASLDILTPYKGICSVLPAQYFTFQAGRLTQTTHWSAVAGGVILYRTDRDYEEHFLQAFTRAVERRAARGELILAELSGGMDSTSIVCISDLRRRAGGCGSNDLLDTISYYDDTEPHWDDRSYITQVEEHRQKRGYHLDASSMGVNPGSADGRFLLPGRGRDAISVEELFERTVGQNHYRIVLSGLGGDELLGGVPNPMPELADYLWSARFDTFARQTFQWSLANRFPVSHLAVASARYMLSLHWPGFAPNAESPPWVKNAKCYARPAAHHGFSSHVFSARPSSIAMEMSLSSIAATLPHVTPNALVRREYRYPYLDRDLIDYLVRIPREQLLRPRERRSLMRRSLRHVVPNAILNRRRKAFIARKPALWLQHFDLDIHALSNDLYLGELGCVDPAKLISHLPAISSLSDTRWSMDLAKTVGLELWIRGRFNDIERAPPVKRARPCDVALTSNDIRAEHIR